ncbi:MAG: NAD(P)H-hydrate dehydratase [Geminicoccaceae bacterium]
MSASLDLLSNAAATSVDRSAMEGGIPGIELMENAGRGIVRELFRRYAPRRVVVLCGPGNNGGDGYVVARRLAAVGIEVETACIGNREDLAGDAALASARWAGKHESLEKITFGPGDIVVDALFGSGLARNFEGVGVVALKRAQAAGSTIVAVDVPSGVSGSTGAIQGWAPKADLTVTFNRLKLGHVLQPGRSRCGDIVAVDIGIPDLYQLCSDNLPRVNDPSLWRELLPASGTTQSKYDRGHLVVMGGPETMTGAAILAAHAGEAAGAGLTTIIGDPSSLHVYHAHLVSIMVRASRDPADLLDFIRERRVRSIVAGPGWGLDDGRADLLELVLTSDCPCVLDADAITLVARDPGRFFDLLHERCVLTPHEGEMARLSPERGPKLERALAFAGQAGCVLLLKGSDTVLASPDGRALVNVNAPASLAKAGSGDTLSGLIGGLLAGGMPPFEAAAAGTWLHAAAAAELGDFRSVERLADQIPAVIHETRMSG